MNVGGITDRLVRPCRARWLGALPGARSAQDQRAAVGCFFAGISGIVHRGTRASQSKIFIEAQVKEGYGLSFSIAITAVVGGGSR